MQGLALVQVYAAFFGGSCSASSRLSRIRFAQICALPPVGGSGGRLSGQQSAHVKGSSGMTVVTPTVLPTQNHPAQTGNMSLHSEKIVAAHP